MTQHAHGRHRASRTHLKVSSSVAAATLGTMLLTVPAQAASAAGNSSAPGSQVTSPAKKSTGGSEAPVSPSPSPTSSTPPAKTTGPVSKTPEKDTQAPSTPAGLHVSRAKASAATVSWGPASDNRAVTSYKVYVDGAARTTTGARSYTLTGLKPGANHSVVVTAVDKAGNESLRSAPVTVSAKQKAPAAPSNVHSSGVTESAATISWSPVSGATKYRVLCKGKTYTVSGTSARLTGLSPKTGYTVTVVALNQAGPSAPATTSLTTDAPKDTQAPTAPTQVAATNVTETSATLTWQASTDDVGVAGYKVYVDGKATSVSGTSFDVSDLKAGTSYTMSVSAVDAAGNESAKTSVTFSTKKDTEAPEAPKPSVSDVTDSGATVSWPAVEDPSGVKSYEVFVDGKSMSTTSNTSYKVTGLDPSSQHTVSLKVTDQAGNESEMGPKTSFTTKADETAPTAPQDVDVSKVKATSATVSWAASDDNVGVTKYLVSVDGKQVGTTDKTSFNLTGLDEATDYDVSVVAVDAAGNKSEPGKTSFATADVTAPSAPTLMSVGSTTTTVDLVWLGADDNVAVDHYVVYMDGQKVGTTEDIGYTVKGLDPNTEYKFKVVAVDAAGNESKASNQVTESTLADTQAPTVPTNLEASQVTKSSAHISWDASSDDVQVAGYYVFVDGELVATVKDTSYDLTGLELGESYSVTVSAFDEAGNGSVQSNPVTVTPTNHAPSAPTVTVDQVGRTSATVSWSGASDPDGSVAKYLVVVDGKQVAETAAASYTVTGLAPGSSHTVSIVAVDNDGAESRASNSVSFTTATVANKAPSAPVNVSVSSVETDSAAVSWDPASDPDGSVVNYVVFVDGAWAGTTTSTSMALAGLSPETTYTVTVKAIDNDGAYSSASDAVSFTTDPVSNPTPPPTDPPTGPPTDPPTSPTPPPTSPTPPPTEPTPPPSEPTQPPTEPTQPPSNPVVPPVTPAPPKSAPPTKKTPPPAAPSLPGLESGQADDLANAAPMLPGLTQEDSQPFVAPPEAPGLSSSGSGATSDSSGESSPSKSPSKTHEPSDSKTNALPEPKSDSSSADHKKQDDSSMAWEWWLLPAGLLASIAGVIWFLVARRRKDGNADA